MTVEATNFFYQASFRRVFFDLHCITCKCMPARSDDPDFNEIQVDKR